ncbi:hypothetical protein MHYP_G00363580 [Metynnis hypsauchen]
MKIIQFHNHCLCWISYGFNTLQTATALLNELGVAYQNGLQCNCDIIRRLSINQVSTFYIQHLLFLLNFFIKYIKIHMDGDLSYVTLSDIH